MLRFGHAPSDFDPLFLVLGEAADLLALARVLRGFAERPAALDLVAALPGARGPTRLALAPEHGEDGAYGVRPDGAGGFRWGLNAWQAEQVAERVERLADPSERSGSDVVEFGVEGEIPMKLSRGEFTDDFLVRRF